MNLSLARRCRLALWLVPLCLVIMAHVIAQDDVIDPPPGGATIQRQTPEEDDPGLNSAKSPGVDIPGLGQAGDQDPIPGGVGGGFRRGFGGGGYGLSPYGGGQNAAGTNQRMVQGATMIISWSKGLDELRGFSQKTGEWSLLKIEKQSTLIPVVGGDVAAVRVGDTMAAYSATTGSWDTLQLSSGSKAIPSVGDAIVQTTDNDRFYTFAAAKGKWTSPNDPNLRRASSLDPYATDANTLPPGRRKGASYPTPAATDVDGMNSRLDLQARELARKLRGKGLDDPQARKALSDAVADAFDRRQAHHSDEARRLSEKLEKIQAAIASRASLRERIIARRVDELLDPDIDWDTDAAGAPWRPRNNQQPQPATSRADGQLPGTAIGLPGPPHIPLGVVAPARTTNAPSGFAGPGIKSANLPSTWRPAYDHHRALSERRQAAADAHEQVWANETYLKESQQPLEEVRKAFYRSMTEEERVSRVSIFEQKGHRLQQQFLERMAQWKQEWNHFESQLEIMQLDVEEAKVKMKGAAGKLMVAERISAAMKNRGPSAELREAETDLELAKIAVDRAERILAPYLELRKELDFLNPASFEAELAAKESSEADSSPENAAAKVRAR